MYSKNEILNRWKKIIDRCGTEEGYLDVYICEEWKNFSNFEQWFINHQYGTKQFKLEVDKDLFTIHEKMYSPDTCCLLPRSLNGLLASCTSRNGLLPGVQLTKANTYKSSITRVGKCSKRTFRTELEAFEYYKEEKKKHIIIAAEAYKFLLPEYVYTALINYEIKPLRRTCSNLYAFDKAYIEPQNTRRCYTVTPVTRKNKQV